MNIFSLIYKFLDYLGFNCKSGSILFIGLDNAGKTSLLNLLKNKCIIIQVMQFRPNILIFKK